MGSSGSAGQAQSHNFPQAPCPGPGYTNGSAPPCWSRDSYDFSLGFWHVFGGFAVWDFLLLFFFSNPCCPICCLIYFGEMRVAFALMSG